MSFASNIEALNKIARRSEAIVTAPPLSYTPFSDSLGSNSLRQLADTLLIKAGRIRLKNPERADTMERHAMSYLSQAGNRGPAFDKREQYRRTHPPLPR